MSRTFRRDESGRKNQDTRRAKKREKANSHYSDTLDDYQNWSKERYRKVNNHSQYYDLDTEND